MNSYNPIQRREIFHLLFLRSLVRSIPPETFALKGGANLRFFFGSVRYSEDMDIDVSGISVDALREKVMKVFESSGLIDSLSTFGIDDLRLPDMARAKQTETVQRFKIGLLTSAGEDLATKVEFSRRGMDEGIRAEPVSTSVLAAYRMAPMIVPHYDAFSAALQKVRALLLRAQPQARDVFDLYLLSTQPELGKSNLGQTLEQPEIRQIRERIYSLGYQQFRDTVVSFLGPEDMMVYETNQSWDEIRLSVLAMFGSEMADEH